MRKKILTLVIVIISFSIGYCQSPQVIDSLMRSLKAAPHDSVKVRVYEELAYQYADMKSDTALYYARKGMTLTKNLPPVYRALMKGSIGRIKSINRLDDYGVLELSEALAIYETLGDSAGMATSHQNLGNAFEKKSLLEKATFHLLESARLRRYLGDNRKLAFALNGLGLVYDKMRLYDRAMECYKEGITYLEPNDPSRNMFLNNMGMIYLERDQSLEAKNVYLKIFNDPSMKGNERRIASVAGNLGESYFRLEMFDSAIFYSSKSLLMKQKNGPPATVAFPAFTLAKVYQKRREFDKAIQYAELALNVSTQFADIENIHDATKILSWIYRDAGQPQKAYDHLLNAYNLRDSLANMATIQAVNDAQIKYDSELTDWENKNLRQAADLNEQTIQTQRIILAGVVIVILLLVVIALLFRKQLQERKKLLTKIENQANKLAELDAAKTRFFANISHDLRTPLSLILGAFDNIQEREDKLLDSVSKEELEMGYRNAKRLLYMADEIMDLTRLEEGKLKIQLQQVKIVPYTRLLVKMFHSATDIKDISLSFNSNIDEEAIVTLDPYQFEKVIYNLLSNAIKHTPAKGSIQVGIQPLMHEEIQLTIADTGTGISAESLPHIFDRFYQSLTNAYKAQEGIGIGLALVKEIIDLHEGKIYADSTLGVGTTFFIQLPYNPIDWTSEAHVPAPSTQLLSRNSLWTDLLEGQSELQVPDLISKADGFTVLIVEDHKEVRSFLKSMLHENYRLLMAANGLEALNILEREQVDVILTDLMMPLMDGFELIERLKDDKSLRKIPVIVISARTSMSEKVELIGRGAEDVLTKPFVKEELLARISSILSRKDWNSQKNLPFSSAKWDDLEKEILKKVEVLIIKRISDPHLSVLDIANELAASERKTYRLIRKIAGITPYELIKEVRWQYIYQQLKTEKIRTATEAATLIGMTNPSDFSKQFEQRFGQPLTELLHKS